MTTCRSTTTITYNATKLYGQTIWLDHFERFKIGPQDTEWAKKFAGEQRRARQRDSLHPKRIEMLDAIGFDWSWPVEWRQMTVTELISELSRYDPNTTVRLTENPSSGSVDKYKANPLYISILRGLLSLS